ncbi:MAG TPA: hypothetical protein VI818_07400 [Candidatus Thermoplasmatota archaeon]|nr:hypothetical protein [Candidatus Thermoplasmatota archaeon]
MGRSVLWLVASAFVASAALSGCFHNPAAVAVDQFLSGNVYTRLHVEIDHQQGKAPHASAQDMLRNRILERCNKPDGVQIQVTPFPESDDTWTLSEIKALEKLKRDNGASGNTAVLYILYLGGKYETEGVIGVQYGPTSFALFKDTIANAANPTNPVLPLAFTATDVERSVIVHEFGHVLGLVNHGTPMVRDHEDKERPGHSKNKDSVMYYAVESLFLGQVFSGPPPTNFDADDIADLRAAGGK